MPNVKSVIMLYSGKLSSYKELTAKEAATFQKFGAQAYLRILDYDLSQGKKAEDLYPVLKTIITEMSGLPGNILVHCYGGMHRTGVLYGVMQKCLNKLPIELVMDEYKCHTAWQSAEQPGLFHKDNETVIRNFPCEMLK